MVSWGVGSFLAKLATNRIGGKSVVWDLLGYIPATLVYGLILFRVKDLLVSDRIGILLAVCAGVVGSFGGIWFYILLSRKDASVIVPLTALYPALTAILAFLFLHESLTWTKIIGIILATLAVFLLSI